MATKKPTAIETKKGGRVASHQFQFSVFRIVYSSYRTSLSFIFLSISLSNTIFIIIIIIINFFFFCLLFKDNILLIENLQI